MKIIPELRFPEFQDDGEWENKPLDDLCKLVRGPFGGALKKEIFVQIGFAVYEQSHAIYSDFNSFRYRINAEKFSELKRFAVTANDLIMSCSGTMGKFAIIPENYEPGIINQALLKLTIKKGFDISFVKISLETENNQNQLLSQSAGGAIKNVVSVSQIKELKLAAPQLQEQQKIASCLSSLDELIAAHSQKLDLLKDHKKGLMQNLFPNPSSGSGGESVPKYRFPEFESDGDWVESRLVQHIELISGYAFKSKFFSEKGRKLVTPKNFTKEGKGSFDEGNTKYTTEEFDSKYLCTADDLLLLLTDLSPSCELLGKPLLLTQEDGEVLLNQRIVKVDIQSNLNKSFLLQFFLTNNFRRRIKSTASGTTVRHSSNKIILGTDFLIPQNPMEQENIALCLSAVDELITAQAERIAQLQQHKKGLMQGLFPKMEG
jgi:type I restriction enzyme S subunit